MKKIISKKTLLLLSLLLFLPVFSGCFLTPSVNQAPTITSTPSTTATVAEVYAYNVNATDPDEDTLTYSLTTNPTGMTINSTTGVISWTPTSTQIGNNSVTVKAFDGALDDTQSFIIIVSEAEAPIIPSPTYPRVSAITITTNPVDVTGVVNSGTVTVTLATVTIGAEIRYTTDGSAPTASSTLYSTPFPVTTANSAGETKVVKAMGIKAGYTNSAIAEKAIVFSAALVVATDTPVITVPVRAGETSVSGTAEAGASVVLTLNSDTPEAAVVATGGAWTVTGLTLAVDDVISVTALTTGKTISAAATTTVLAALVATDTPVITGPVRAGETSVSGTAEAGASVVLTLEGTPEPAVVATGGAWTVTGLTLAVDDVISVTALTTGKTISAAATTTVLAALVLNGGFETGDFTGWTATAVDSGEVVTVSDFPQVQSSETYSGSNAAYMGDGNSVLGGHNTASIEQIIDIPDLVGLYLKINYLVIGTDTFGAGYDWMKFYIDDVEIFYVWQDSAGWQEVTFDLDPYIHTSITLKISAWTADAYDPVDYYVDNIRIE